jgi:hypothetical protein
MIYFLRAGDTDLVKIGFADNVIRRVSALQAGNHLKLSVFRQIEGGLQVERWLHRRFQSCRIDREWFTFSADMLTIEPPTISAPKSMLATYLQDRGISEARFAEMIGVSQAAVNRYIAGKRRPRRAVVLRIMAATQGAVTANDLYGLSA